MKKTQIRGLWVFVLAVVLCFTFLSRDDRDVYSVAYGADSFTKRYLPEYSGDAADPQKYVEAENGTVAVYTLRHGALSVRANNYSVGLQYQGESEGTVLKVFSSDYVSEDNSGGKILLQEPLPAQSNSFSGTFELNQDINSLYIVVETTDTAFAPEGIQLKSETPVSNDRYFYCAAVLVIACAVFWLMNSSKTKIQPFSLGHLESNPQKTRLAFVFVMAAAVFVGCLPLAQDMIFVGHDMSFHLARIEGIASALKSGQFPARVHGETLNGFGYANSLFYPELLMYVPAMLSLLGISIITCYKFYMVFVTALTMIFGYFSFKKLFGSRYVGLALAVIYLLNPYRIICGYYRCALGEFTAFTFLPLIVYGLYAVLIGNKKDWPWLVGGATGLLQSHILTTELTAFAAAVIVLMFVKNLFGKEKRIVPLLYAAGFTVLLNIWFIVPMLLMTVSIQPVVFGRVQNPMGFSAFDIGALFNAVEILPIGPHTVGWVILFGTAGYILYRIAICDQQQTKDKYRFGDGMVWVTVVCAFATTAYFPWEKILRVPVLGKLMDTIQFPYRLLSLVAVCGTVVVGYAVVCWLKEKRHRMFVLLAAISASAFFACLFFEIGFNKDIATYENKHYYTNNMNNSLSVGQYEYLPAGADLNDIVEHSPRILSENQTLLVNDWKRNGTNMTFAYEMTLTQTEQDKIVLPLTYIPGYQVLINGKPVETLPADGYKVSFVPTEANGIITVKYSEPVLFRLSELVSLGTLAVLAVLPMCQGKDWRTMFHKKVFEMFLGRLGDENQ